MNFELQMFGGRGGSSGGGGGGSSSSGNMSASQIQETRSILTNQLNEAEKVYNTIPTKKEVDKALNELVRNGSMSEFDRDTYNKLYKNGIVEDNLSSHFVDMMRSYKYDARPLDGETSNQHSDRINATDIANLRSVSIRGANEIGQRQTQKIVRDFGSYIAGIGRHSMSNEVRFEAAKKALSDFESEISKSKKH